MEKGKITEVGTYDELLQEGKNFAKFLEEYATNQEGDEEDEAECKNATHTTVITAWILWSWDL